MADDYDDHDQLEQQADQEEAFKLIEADLNTRAPTNYQELFE